MQKCPESVAEERNNRKIKERALTEAHRTGEALEAEVSGADCRQKAVLLRLVNSTVPTCPFIPPLVGN